MIKPGGQIILTPVNLPSAQPLMKPLPIDKLLATIDGICDTYLVIPSQVLTVISH